MGRKYLRDDDRTAEEIIATLGAIRRSPAVFAEADTPEAVWMLILGMIKALHITGYDFLMPRRDDFRDAVQEERGWQRGDFLIEQMRSAGHSERAIINELIAIETEAVRRRAEAKRQSKETS